MYWLRIRQSALINAGFGKFHFFLLTVCGMIYMNTAIGITIISFVLPSATCDFRMSSSDKGLLTAAPMLGMNYSNLLLWNNRLDLLLPKKIYQPLTVVCFYYFLWRYASRFIFLGLFGWYKRQKSCIGRHITVRWILWSFIVDSSILQFIHVIPIFQWIWVSLVGLGFLGAISLGTIIHWSILIVCNKQIIVLPAQWVYASHIWVNFNQQSTGRKFYVGWKCFGPLGL